MGLVDWKVIRLIHYKGHPLKHKKYIWKYRYQKFGHGLNDKFCYLKQQNSKFI